MKPIRLLPFFFFLHNRFFLLEKNFSLLEKPGCVRETGGMTPRDFLSGTEGFAGFGQKRSYVGNGLRLFLSAERAVPECAAHGGKRRETGCASYIKS